MPKYKTLPHLSSRLILADEPSNNYTGYHFHNCRATYIIMTLFLLKLTTAMCVKAIIYYSKFTKNHFHAKTVQKYFESLYLINY